MEKGDEVRPALAIRVSSLEDLARLAGSNAARMMVMPIYSFPYKDKRVFMVQTIFKDHYKLYGIPMIYYYVASDDKTSKFLLWRVDDEGEKVILSDKSMPGWVVIPVINLTDKPIFLGDLDVD